MQPRSTQGITLYTIGHSDRDIDTFVAILRAFSIRGVVDIRARPTSRRCPQYCGERLRDDLLQARIHYHWAGKRLGGFRPESSKSTHSALRSAALRAYADHMQSEEFRFGIADVLTRASDDPVAVLCSERRPENCHRLLVADYLVAVAGLCVQHIIGLDESCEHRLSPSIRCLADGSLIYDQPVGKQLALRLE